MVRAALSIRAESCCVRQRVTHPAHAAVAPTCAVTHRCNSAYECAFDSTDDNGATCEDEPPAACEVAPGIESTAEPSPPARACEEGPSAQCENEELPAMAVCQDAACECEDEPALDIGAAAPSPPARSRPPPLWLPTAPAQWLVVALHLVVIEGGGGPGGGRSPGPPPPSIPPSPNGHDGDVHMQSWARRKCAHANEHARLSTWTKTSMGDRD